MSSFTEKQLRATLILADPNTKFPGTNSNTLILTGLQMIAVIEGITRRATQLDLQIHGMTQGDMEALTVVWFQPPAIKDNAIVLEANDGTGWTQVFSGTITEAQPEFRSAPAVFFRIQAVVGYLAKITPVPVTSYSQDVPVSTVVAAIAKQMGFAFEDNGVTAILHKPYFPGTLYDQLQSACAAGNVDYYIEGGKVSIMPANKPRLNTPVIVLNKDSGLVGYPVLERFGISVQCLFNPAIIGGGKIKVQSSFKPANGLWTPYYVTHTLESVRPGGNWFSLLLCNPAF